MRDQVCVVKVGIHPPPYWRDKIRQTLVVYSRHQAQYDERDDLGPFDWEAFDPKVKS